MPRIRCHYTDCVFLDDNYCGAAAVEIDPDTGCATYSPIEETSSKGEEWDNEEEWEDDESEDEEDEWVDDEEDEF